MLPLIRARLPRMRAGVEYYLEGNLEVILSPYAVSHMTVDSTVSGVGD